MSRIEVTLVTGQRIALAAPAVLTVDPPRPVQEVRYAYAVALAEQIEPQIVRRPDTKHVVRDSNGRISGLREFEADPSRRALAWQAATRLVDQLIPLDVATPTEPHDAAVFTLLQMQRSPSRSPHKRVRSLLQMQRSHTT